jgi:hypothetical protein
VKSPTVNSVKIPLRIDRVPPRMSCECSERYSLMWVVASAAAARCDAEIAVASK